MDSLFFIFAASSFGRSYGIESGDALKGSMAERKVCIVSDVSQYLLWGSIPLKHFWDLNSASFSFGPLPASLENARLCSDMQTIAVSERTVKGGEREDLSEPGDSYFCSE